MNSIQAHTFLATAWALPDARRVAQEAIANHDQARLQQMLDAEEIDANTRTPDGATLLIEAVRSLNARAFASLIQDPDAIDLNTADADGNTAMHHLALRMADEVLDNEWEQVLTELLEQHASDIDWHLTNRDDQTALDLSLMDGRDRVAALFDPYAPEEPRSIQSSHGDSHTNEEFYSDLHSENFDHLNAEQQARVESTHKLLNRKRGR